ncbi:MAG: hypothetical protein ACO1SV_26275 [Fimbriimonas sp.]
MCSTKATLILSATTILASAASAQSFSGSVETVANVAGGSRTVKTWSNLLPGQTSAAMRLDNAGPGITAFGEAFAGPGLLMTRRDVTSAGIPYGQSWGKATYRDAVRWNGPAPITVRMCARLAGDLYVGGSNPLQTNSSAYANLIFFGDTLNYSQTLQRGKTVEGTWDTTRGGINDIVVTLRPGRWYTFTSTLQVNGDASDMTKLYTGTYSRGDYALKIWFEPIGTPGLGTLQSGSGHDYSVEPVLPAVQ